MWKKIIIGVGIGLGALIVVVGVGFGVLMLGRRAFGWFGGNSPMGLTQNMPFGPMMRGFRTEQNFRMGPGMMDRNGQGFQMMPGRSGENGFGMRGQQFSQADLTTQDATVKQADANLVLLEFADGTSYALQNQALWYIQQQGLTLKAGDTLKATGFNVKMDDTHTFYHLVSLEDSSGKQVGLPGMFGMP